MDLKIILKKVPRVIEKIIIDNVLDYHYLNKHKQKFKNSLIGIKKLYSCRTPEMINLVNVFEIIYVFRL